MHHIYHTEAFVLGSNQNGEDSKIITLYTKELGLVRAKAQGIRKLASKLRFTLQNFSYAKVDLVRGKEIWRITTASPLDSNTDILCFPEREKVMVHIMSLVARLVARGVRVWTVRHGVSLENGFHSRKFAFPID